METSTSSDTSATNKEAKFTYGSYALCQYNNHVYKITRVNDDLTTYMCIDLLGNNTEYFMSENELITINDARNAYIKQQKG